MGINRQVVKALINQDSLIDRDIMFVGSENLGEHEGTQLY
jgi:hypothetical protein